MSSSRFGSRRVRWAAEGPAMQLARRCRGASQRTKLRALLAFGFLLGPAGASAAEVSFEKHVITTTASNLEQIFAADMDGDGYADVLSASEGDDRIAWWESDGGAPPLFFEPAISTSAESADEVYAADVDGDGDVDVLSASSGDDKIAWYEQLVNGAGPASAAPERATQMP